MKTSMTLQQLATEVERQKSGLHVVRDFTAPTEKLTMTDKNNLLVGDLEMGITDYAHGQIASRLKIPMQYYRRMQEEVPDLLADNVNKWFKENAETRLVRVLDNNVRAFLSSSYRCLDNYDLLKAVLPILKSMGNVEIKSCDISMNKMYLKAVFPELQTEVKGSKRVGDLVQAGVCISNSEVGDGSLKIEPFLYFLVCTNGMITNSVMRKYHVGGKRDGYSDIQELLSDETKEISDRAIWMQVQDVLKNSLNRDVFEAEVARCSETTEREINPTKAAEIVERVTKKYSFNEEQGGQILGHLIAGGDLTQWGLINAVTRSAEDQDNYEKATEMERTGGKMLGIDLSDWTELAS